jgi:hypothetical protein
VQCALYGVGLCSGGLQAGFLVVNCALFRAAKKPKAKICRPKGRRYITKGKEPAGRRRYEIPGNSAKEVVDGAVPRSIAGRSMLRPYRDEKPEVGCSGLQPRPACGNKLLQRHLARTITDGAQSLPK